MKIILAAAFLLTCLSADVSAQASKAEREAAALKIWIAEAGCNRDAARLERFFSGDLVHTHATVLTPV